MVPSELLSFVVGARGVSYKLNLDRWVCEKSAWNVSTLSWDFCFWLQDCHLMPPNNFMKC